MNEFGPFLIFLFIHLFNLVSAMKRVDMPIRAAVVGSLLGNRGN